MSKTGDLFIEVEDAIPVVLNLARESLRLRREELRQLSRQIRQDDEAIMRVGNFYDMTSGKPHHAL